MRKTICTICGTEYLSTEKECPACGWPNEQLDSDMNQGMSAVDAAPSEFATAEIFDFDAVNNASSKVEDSYDDYDEDSYEEYEEEPKKHTGLIVFLIILIVALLIGIGFFAVRYLFPAGSSDAPGSGDQIMVAEPVETEAPVTEAPTIPCTTLTMVSQPAVLTGEGNQFLIHVKAFPEDTTDVVTFESKDEAVVTVTADGQLTAVGEGEAVVVITCGSQVLETNVVVQYEKPTTVPETTETMPTFQQEDPTEPPATEETTPTNPDVVLKLKKDDITFGICGVYVELELDCELTADQVEWTVGNPGVAVVENGKVTAVGSGITTVTARYGGQEAVCIVRCIF